MDLTNFSTYAHIYSSVKALKLTAENRAAIVRALISELIDMKFATLDYAGPSNILESAVPTITFRYRDDTTSYVLTEDTYLVYLDDIKKFVVMTAEMFEKYYRESEDPIYPEIEIPLTDEALTDVAVLVN